MFRMCPSTALTPLNTVWVRRELAEVERGKGGGRSSCVVRNTTVEESLGRPLYYAPKIETRTKTMIEGELRFT